MREKETGMPRTDWLTGPVAITGADGQVGRALQTYLTDLPNEVRALRRDDDWAAAFSGAEAVVHLAGTLQPRRPNTYQAANLETVRRTVSALEGSSIGRIVFLSFITADPSSTNPYLRAKAEAEALVQASGVPAVIFRCDHIYGPPDDPGPTASSFLAKGSRPASVLGKGTQRTAPIYRGDVVEAVAHAALDPTTPVGVFELAGSQDLTVDEFARILNRHDVRIRHLGPGLARVLSHVLPSLPYGLVDVMLHDTVPSGESRDVAGMFGVRLHTLEEVWGEPTFKRTTG